MNDLEKKVAARDLVVEKFLPTIENEAGVRFGDASWAFLTEQDGQEVWVEVTFKSKAFKDTKRSKAFDPFVEEQEWKEVLQERAQKKADQEAKKKERG